MTLIITVTGFNGVPTEAPAFSEAVPTATVAEDVSVATDVSASIVFSDIIESPENVLATIPEVPFYSQIRDISSPKWQKLSCGIADLAMIINFYKPGAVVPDALLKEGLAAGAFIDGVGWKHQGLADLARSYGFEGKSYNFSNSDKSAAFIAIEKLLKEGPVIASVYYTFNPDSPIPHLVVINGIEEGFVYYNDPAARVANQKISIAGFMRGWKKRLIVIRPQSLAVNQ